MNIERLVRDGGRDTFTHTHTDVSVSVFACIQGWPEPGPELTWRNRLRWDMT
jgi:hypothetical protein